MQRSPARHERASWSGNDRGGFTPSTYSITSSAWANNRCRFLLRPRETRPSREGRAGYHKSAPFQPIAAVNANMLPCSRHQATSSVSPMTYHHPNRDANRADPFAERAMNARLISGGQLAIWIPSLDFAIWRRWRRATGGATITSTINFRCMPLKGRRGLISSCLG